MNHKKGRIKLKKLYTSMTLIGVASVIMAGQAMAAAQNSVTVSRRDNPKEVTLKYDSDKTASMDITSIFKDLRFVTTKKAITQPIAVTNTSIGPKELSLVISIDNPTDKEYSPLDYYSFEINTVKETIVDNKTEIESKPYYVSGENTLSPISETVKIIPLGTFSESFKTETKKYDVTYTVSADGAKYLKSEDVADLKISIMEEPVKTGNAQTNNNSAVTGATATNAPTESPANSGTTLVATPVPTATPAATTAPSATPGAEKEKKWVIGQDKDANGKVLKAGKYKISGNGKVKITDKDGKVKSETIVTDGKLEGVKGVKEFYATVAEGDIITANPLDGQEKAQIALTAVASTTANSAASKTNNASKSNTGSTSSASAANAKTNPKTGDRGPAIGLICAVMAVCAVGFGGMGLLKRRNKNTKA